MQQHLRKVDHKQLQVEGIGQGNFIDIHEIFQTPKLFGIPEIDLDLEAQTVAVDNLFVRQFQITCEQVDVGNDTRLEIGFGDDDHVERLSEIMMQNHSLVDVDA